MYLKELAKKFIEYPVGPSEDINERLYELQTTSFILGGKVLANKIANIILNNNFNAETATVDECLVLIKQIIDIIKEFLKDGR